MCYNKNMEVRSYFMITGDVQAQTLVERIGVAPDKILGKGEALPCGKRVEQTTLLFGVRERTDEPISQSMLFSVSALIDKEELLGDLKEELALTYYLFIPDEYKGELIIVPAPLARFLYLSKTFRDLDYYTF